MTYLKPLISLFLALILLGACAGNKRDSSLESTLNNYANLLRWSEFQGALNHHAPEWLAENPITELELSRLALFSISGYEAISRSMDPDGSRLQQQVRLELYSKRDARARVIIHQQDWRYDEEKNRWLLHSNLPDVTRR